MFQHLVTSRPKQSARKASSTTWRWPNCAVKNAFAVNRESGQFKAPFNELFSEARAFTHEDTAAVTPVSRPLRFIGATSYISTVLEAWAKPLSALGGLVIPMDM